MQTQKTRDLKTWWQNRCKNTKSPSRTLNKCQDTRREKSKTENGQMRSRRSWWRWKPWQFGLQGIDNFHYFSEVISLFLFLNFFANNSNIGCNKVFWCDKFKIHSKNGNDENQTRQSRDGAKAHQRWKPQY